MKCTVQLDGYSGEGPELVRFVINSTGLKVVMEEPLASELLKAMRGSGSSVSIKDR